jgi:sulfotransferase family protein
VGYQLGAPPSPAAAFRVIATGQITRRVTRVASANPAPAHPALLAGALDTPLPGTVSPGRGVEFNGWVIPASGEHIDGVFTVVEEVRGQLQPLSVPRPDVTRDYPSASPSNAGFSFWCPVPDTSTARIQLVSRFSSGDLVPLLDLHVALEEERPEAAPDLRVVGAPDFVIIGTQRGGTTSLHAYLRAHPHIETPAKKEIHFLTDRYERGPEWYIGQFPAAVTSRTLVGEATPYALFHPLAPQRFREVAPEARVIVLLRNPADRAYSHYLHERARGHEPLSFEDAIAAEPERLRGLDAQLASGELLASDTHKRASYVERGRYARQLERWLAVFPPEQVLILRSEDLYAAPAEATKRVTDFLGLTPLRSDVFATHNATAGPPLRTDTRQMLMAEFAGDNARLADLLGWDPAWT